MGSDTNKHVLAVIFSFFVVHLGNALLDNVIDNGCTSCDFFEVVIYQRICQILCMCVYTLYLFWWMSRALVEGGFQILFKSPPAVPIISRLGLRGRGIFIINMETRCFIKKYLLARNWYGTSMVQEEGVISLGVARLKALLLA